MNLLKQYRESKSMKQSELAAELQPVCPGITGPVISLMENGIVNPTKEVQEYVEKAFINGKTGGEDAEMINVPSAIKDYLKMPFYRDIYEELKKHNRIKPASRGDLVLATGYPDREVRKGINDLRNAGLRIISSSGSYGYWLSDEPSDYAVMRAELNRKAKSLLSMIHAMDKCDMNQVEMDL